MTGKSSVMVDEMRDIEDLLAQVALQNRQAFSKLYDATSATLLAICLRVLGERDTAEDAMQEAYIKVWHNAERYQVTGHSPMTWLITIARNTAIDKLRARKIHENTTVLDEHIISRGPTPEQSAVAASELNRTLECLEKLDTQKGAAIKGAYLQGYSYKELSNQFNIPLNTMRTWLRRGLASLRECLSE